MSAASTNKRVVSAWVDAVNHRDLDAALGLHAAEYKDHSPGHEDTSLETLRVALTTMFSAFPDLRYDSEDVIAEDDKVVERFSSRGTHGGVFMGVQPTGRQVTITGINIYRIADGKIVERWAQVNDLAMMQQLGIRAERPHSHD